jgi:hypothetical protein
MYLLCEKLRVLPNGGGLMDQTPTNVDRMMALHAAREERARADDEREKNAGKSS